MILSSYTKALKSYDSDLFAGRTKDGLPGVFRRYKRLEEVCDLDGIPLLLVKYQPQFVFALTENWTFATPPRDWGIDFVLQKIKSIDAVANARLLEEMDEANEAIDKSRARHMRNEMEAFWSHERRRFAKATDDILTHSLSKDEPRKRLKDRSIKNA